MARPVTTRDDTYMKTLAAELDKRAKAAAAELGPVADSVKLSDADKVARWLHHLPDEAAMQLIEWARVVVEEGQQIPPPEVGHPNPMRVVEWYAKQDGPAAASEARWPFRRDLWERGNVAIEDQVKAAQAMARLAARHASAGDQDGRSSDPSASRPAYSPASFPGTDDRV